MQTIYDIAGIGIGPFNLGLAALCHPIRKMKTIFIDQRPAFSWHAGMMIPGTSLQVSYLADLVTLADPSSRFSYLNYLRRHNRLLQFGVHENNYITRCEYNRYCRWVAGALRNLLFGYRVEELRFDKALDCFEIKCTGRAGKSISLRARHIVSGIGSQPCVPAGLAGSTGGLVLHAAAYLENRESLLATRDIVLVGSGQSAAEIFYDLLEPVVAAGAKLAWITRSDRFYAMENSKLVYEMSSPAYIDYFFGLRPEQKASLLQSQQTLYKGINRELINAIYDKLYGLSAEGKPYRVTMHTGAELKRITGNDNDGFSLLFHHKALAEDFRLTAGSVILATGYRDADPFFLKGLNGMVGRDAAGRLKVNRNYSVDRANRVFVQNAEMHTHGFNAPDLGLGAYRNAVIINTILGRDYYPVDTGTCFQYFGLSP